MGAVYPWYQIQETRVVYVGRMTIPAAAEWEKNHPSLNILLTIEGLKMIFEQIQEIL